MKALAFDIGGTKIAAAAVSTDGQLLHQSKIPTPASNWPDAKKALLQLAKTFLDRHPDIKACGIASAGPLHAASGRLLNPTNIHWGDLKITEELERELKIPVLLENDAAAAVIGEHWLGEFKKSEALVMITLGTGLGVGVMVDHNLVRGGRGLHPEGGHLMLSPGDPEAPCGCGNFGCGEAYLAGSHFIKKAQKAFADPTLSAQKLMEKAKVQDPLALQLYEGYSLRLAQFIFNYLVLAYPYHVVLGGSFAQSSVHFLPQTWKNLERFLGHRPRAWLPQISVSQLHNAGLLGAAHLAFKQIDPTFHSV